MSSSYHMVYKTFIEASYINDIYIWERPFAVSTFKGLRDVSFQTE